MATVQDSTDPTGVRETRRGGVEVSAQRKRKADAALSLALSGASWADIAQTLGYPTPRLARQATERALVIQLNSDDDRAQMRALAGARLERLLRAVWPKAVDPSSPDQMTAVSRARDIIDRHAKLFGLDMPTEIVVHNPSQSELEDWVLRMTSSMLPGVIEPDIFEADLIEDPEDDDATG